jgi:hypothetical protein
MSSSKASVKLKGRGPLKSVSERLGRDPKKISGLWVGGGGASHLLYGTAFAFSSNRLLIARGHKGTVASVCAWLKVVWIERAKIG